MSSSQEPTPIVETFDIVRLGKDIHKYINKVFVLTDVEDGFIVTKTGLFVGMVNRQNKYGDGESTIYLAYQEPFVLLSDQMQMVKFYDQP